MKAFLLCFFAKRHFNHVDMFGIGICVATALNERWILAAALTIGFPFASVMLESAYARTFGVKP